MKIYALLPLVSSIFALLLGIFVFKNGKPAIKLDFFLWCSAIFVWLFSYSVCYLTTSERIAVLFARFACTAVMFLANTFYQFIVDFLELSREKRQVRIAYVISFIMLPFFLFSNLFLRGAYKYYWGYYSKAGVLHPLFLLFFFVIFIRGFFLLWQSYRKIKAPQKHRQIKYVFISFLMALLAAIDFIPKYGIEFYPFGFLFMILFISTTAYAIIKYHLMDIHIVLTRTAILAVVYCFIIGIPMLFISFGKPWLKILFHDRWFYPPLLLYTTLALFAPYIYLRLQAKAEEKRIQRQIHLHQSLKAASKTTIEVQSMEKLSKIIPRYLLKLYGREGDKIMHISLFLKDKNTYKLKSSIGEKKLSADMTIAEDSYLVKWFTTVRDVLVE
ncbi:hypothetical protein L6259_00225, partial [Candidatus Parcubacteria bacterium]|nr:hypothetical protein [Candidatus Parcubacteria bacterium]